MTPGQSLPQHTERIQPPPRTRASVQKPAPSLSVFLGPKALGKCSPALGFFPGGCAHGATIASPQFLSSLGAGASARSLQLVVGGALCPRLLVPLGLVSFLDRVSVRRSQSERRRSPGPVPTSCRSPSGHMAQRMGLAFGVSQSLTGRVRGNRKAKRNTRIPCPPSV